MDVDVHQHRKKLFISILDLESVAKLLGLFESRSLHWAESAKPSVIYPLYTVMQHQLTRTVGEWTGIPLRETELLRINRDLTLMFDKAGAKSLGHLAPRRARNDGEDWVAVILK